MQGVVKTKKALYFILYKAFFLFYFYCDRAVIRAEDVGQDY